MGVNVRRRPRRARMRRKPTVIPQARFERIRRLIDVVAALVLLILLAPLLLLGILVVARGGRPLFFGHERLGLNGVRFRCWKLRTMHPDAEKLLDDAPELYRAYVSNDYKIPAAKDPRISPGGHWLRRAYIDELPQLINVLSGSMSLFGPRPIVPAELHHYGRHAAELLLVKPGLFGAWTSLGRARPPYPRRAQLELEYVRTRSFLRDLRILLAAIPAVMAGQSEFA